MTRRKGAIGCLPRRVLVRLVAVNGRLYAEILLTKNDTKYYTQQIKQKAKGRMKQEKSTGKGECHQLFWLFQVERLTRPE